MPQAPVRPHRRPGDWAALRVVETEAMGATWNAAVDAFLRDVRARNCSRATLENYRTYLLGNRAQQFVADYGVRTVADVTPQALREFQAELLDAGLSPQTAATFHRIVRNFLGFCRREGWGIVPEALEVPGPRLPLHEPETFSQAEELRLLEACRTDRDRFLVEFMLRTGLRLSEVANVTLDDIVTGADGAYVRVRQGKGAKDRIVPLDTAHSRLSQRLTAYVRSGRPQDAKDRHLFLGNRRDPVTGDWPPLARDGVKVALRRLGDDTGIHVHPHKFRHTFATRALAAGVDSLVLQRALGHSTLAMVNRYVHFQARDLLNAWRARTD
ncbi:MAG TPA: tyrosine-type recombinase/integrase [Acidimicrobiales bacterium]|nr:tyrosine-type recombinase/integrase [Acidimicrobiales bacterium]